jgi:copper homeostasis protein
MKMLEVACFGADAAITAANNGASRIELCAARSEGGLTPSYGELKRASSLSVPVYPMLRPRGGDFCYTANELGVMKDDLTMIKELGFAGVVFGILNEDGNVNAKAMEPLMDIAQGMKVTFHRAFDVCRDAFTAMDTLSHLGVARILSSGMKSSAKEGINLLRELNAMSRGMIIMAGGGVRATNMRLFMEAGLQEVHTSASMSFTSPMRYQNPDVAMGTSTASEYERYGIDIDALKQMKEILMSY